MNGWFAMRRGIHEHPLFHKQPDRLFVWSWLLANASWKDRRFDVGGEVITVKRGQLCVSQKQIEDATGVSRKVIRNLISALERENAVGTKPANGRAKGKTLITIINYDKYQSPENDKGQAKGQDGAKQGPIKEQGNKDNNLEANASKEADASEVVPVSILKKSVWESGKHYLSQHGQKNPGQLIGKWLKSNSHVELAHALDAAIASGTQDPVPYIEATLKPSTQPDLDALMDGVSFGGHG